ncbi:hypothetical protein YASMINEVIRUS_1077 [Yasminevirus sp. GU-2018]|uniref:Uncharacterized protein n=1 Tax=Yasminevirus sp. GU-2018 TaxID=2420051 RepID=A0A5K0UAU8_9VIRU|nr:hypothetical protein YASMINEVIRUS_1077 [Yasminevirus sp. GU-2018]
MLIIAFLTVVIMIWRSDNQPNSNKTDNTQKREHFVEKADCTDADCEDTSLLEIDNELLQSPMRYMTVNEFNKMVSDIQDLVIDKISDLVQTCSDMNGSDGLQKDHMTFTCLADTDDIEEQVVALIVAYIGSSIKKKYGINMNPYLVTSVFMNHLDLLDGVVYPLLYSKHFTVHGINYFTRDMLVEKVHQNLKINDVLYTTLLKRGIDVLPNNDEHGENIVTN